MIHRPQPEPFHIAIPETDLADLRRRLMETRWPDELEDVGWSYGTPTRYLRELVDYWRSEFDWRAHERRLNERSQFMVDIDGQHLHFVYERSPHPSAVPVLVLHGWPGSYVQMLELLPRLTNPERFGGGPDDAFHVVIGSLPGFAFSEPFRESGMGEQRMGEVFHALMTRVLGFSRFALRGSDFGSGVISEMAADHPEEVIGIHLSGTTPTTRPMPEDPTDAEREFFENVRRWRAEEVGYAQISGTKPQTLAHALADSPVGVASWIVEKFRRWSDCNGDVESRFSKDQLLLNISVYWLTNSIGSSIRAYKEPAPSQAPDVPAAYLMSRRDMFPTPREWIARHSRIDRWTIVDRGGHFIEWEEPQLIAEDMAAFFSTLR